ncbi:MAG: hypothetical protein JWR75_1432 [Devosia sp.]|nr:hypothetical protein [Devosia sp.]
MPLYFFHIFDGIELRDLEGTELTDLAAARKQAVITAGAIIADLGASSWLGDIWQMTITDADAIVLFELHFLDTSASLS